MSKKLWLGLAATAASAVFFAAAAPASAAQITNKDSQEYVVTIGVGDATSEVKIMPGESKEICDGACTLILGDEILDIIEGNEVVSIIGSQLLYAE